MAAGAPLQFVRNRALPVEEGWECKRSGDCCRKVDYVVMTRQEMDVLLEYGYKHFTLKKMNTLVFRNDIDHKNMVAMVARPCPLLEYVDGKPTCTVHEVRPYNCRRFGCLRPDPKSEPLVMAPLSDVLQYGKVGCVNLRDRLIFSRVARRIYEKLQRKGMRWAVKHGWR